MLKRTVAMMTGAGRVEVATQDLAAPRPREALIKVHASLISPGTEIAGVRARREHPRPDSEAVPFGYANAGEIVEVNGDGGRLAPGVRVAAMGSGYAVHGNYACVPSNLMVPLPDAMPYDEAVYACLAATALQSVQRTRPQLGEYGLVVGQGIVGNLAAQLYQLCGARIMAWEQLPERIRIARACGVANVSDARAGDAVEVARAFAAPHGFGFANFAFGGAADDVLAPVTACMTRSADGHLMGRIVLVGGCRLTLRGGASMGNLDIRVSARTGPGYHDDAYEHGAEYPRGFVPFTTQRNLAEVVRLIHEQRLSVRAMTSHRLPLTGIRDAVELLMEDPNAALGVVIEMPH